jgi:hypothetical protein
MTESKTTEPEEKRWPTASGGNVVSIIEQVSDRQLIEMFSKLWAMVEWQHANIMRDPLPFLKKAAEEGVKSQNMKYAIMDIIYPVPKFCRNHENEAPKMFDERFEMREKLDKIYKLVSQ